MPQPIRIPFPKKGINKNFARSDQNGIQQGFGFQLLPETCFAASNVLPYDRFDRLRGGQRPGTARLFSPLATAPVMALGSQAIALDPTTAPANTLLLSEQFNYANGVALNGSGPWKVYSDTALSIANNHPTIANPPGQVTTFNTSTAYALYSGTPLQLGQSYTISVDFTFDTAAKNYSVLSRINGNNAFVGVELQLVTSVSGGAGTWTIELVEAFSSTVLASAALPAFSATNGQKFTLMLQFNGNAIAGWLNGVSSVSVTSNWGSSFQGWGWYVPAGVNVTVSNVQVKTAAAGVYRQTFLVAVNNGDLYNGSLSAVTKVGAGVIAAGVKPGLAFGQGNAYLCDGSNSVQKLVLSTGGVTTLAPSAGTVPTGCTIAAVWRDRLILAAPAATPQNFYLSRVGTHTDWDYSQSDSAAAFAGSASTAGHIGDPITALMPFNDDVMLIGGDHHLWRVNGDPADGGSIDLVSDAIGVLGPFAWTKDPTGNIYFVGTGGLYRISPGGGPPALLTGQTDNQFFSGITRTQNYITLTWDRDRQGMYVFVTPINPATQGTHLFYDARNDGLWPVQYPLSHGPVAAIVYDGDSGTDRQILLGGFSGLIQKLTPSALDDDGAAISSSITLGPFQPLGPAGDSVVTMMDATMGENFTGDPTADFNASWTIKGGKTAYEVTEGTPRILAGGTFTAPGYQLSQRQRVRGGWFSLTFSNSTIDTYWSMEHAVMHVEGQGKQR